MTNIVRKNLNQGFLVMEEGEGPLQQGHLFANRYRIVDFIGAGSFGKIASVLDIQNQEMYAMKLESLHARAPQLEIEHRLYQKFAGSPNFPKVYYYGVEEGYKIMVMDLLGKSIEDYCSKLRHRFSLKTVLMLADQMLSAVEYMHKLSLIHRDIKPDNFMMGAGANSSNLYIIDFGLSKEFQNPITHSHIPFRQKLNLTGTARYASINALSGNEQSRRDDLESLGYMFVYMLKGSLPWQGLPAKTSAQKYQRILDVKTNTSIDLLCHGIPQAFAQYLHAVRSLEFEEEPKYSEYRKIFRKLFMESGFEYDSLYDWSLSVPRPPRVPRQPSTMPNTPKRSTCPRLSGKNRSPAPSPPLKQIPSRLPRDMTLPNLQTAAGCRNSSQRRQTRPLDEPQRVRIPRSPITPKRGLNFTIGRSQGRFPDRYLAVNN